MKSIKLLMLSGAMLTGLSTFAQSATEIVKKHNDAVGGEAAWAKITSVKMDGTMTMQGMEIPTVTTIVVHKGIRQDMSIMGAANYTIMTPTEGWTYLPAMGQTKAEAMKPEDLKGAADELKFTDDLMEAAAKKEKIEFIGKDKIDTKDVYKLQSTDADGNVTTFYLDATTYYTLRTSGKEKMQGQEMEMTTNYSDYQKLPEGIVVAMSKESDQGSMKIKTLEMNKVKDESIFKPAN